MACWQRQRGGIDKYHDQSYVDMDNEMSLSDYPKSNEMEMRYFGKWNVSKDLMCDILCVLPTVDIYI